MIFLQQKMIFSSDSDYQFIVWSVEFDILPTYVHSWDPL